MIRKAMEKFIKKTKNEGTDNSSIQDRLNQMRRQQPDSLATLQSEPAASGKMSSNRSEPAVQDDDEAFLRRFAEQLNEKPSYQQTTADILREQAEERRKKMQIAPINGVNKNGKSMPPPVATMRKPVAHEPEDQTDSAFPEMGSILYLSDGQVAIFIKNVSSRNYQLVYMINSDATLSSQGIYLSGYEYEQIGKLSGDVFAKMQQELTWDRDILVFHLSNYQNVSLLPKLAAPVIAKVGIGSQNNGAAMDPSALPSHTAMPEHRQPDNPSAPPAVSPNMQPQRPAEPSSESQQENQGQSSQSLSRGRRFKISMGRNRTWEAVYWGKDQQGTVIAHSTNGQWTLMHLDLDRFASSMEMNGLLDDKELHEVENALREQYS